MVTCRRLLNCAGIVVAALCLCDPPFALGSPPQLVVKTANRIQYNGRPSFVGFDAKGTSLLIAGDGGVERWSWPARRKLWSAEARGGGCFVFDGQTLARKVVETVSHWELESGKV